MPDPDDHNDAAMRARLDKLSGALKSRRATDEAELGRKAAPVDGGLGRGMTMAFRVVAELVAGIAVGGAIGYGLDGLFHTKPLFLILFGLLGTGAGFWNIIRETTPKGRAAKVDFSQRLDASRRRTDDGDN